MPVLSHHEERIGHHAGDRPIEILLVEDNEADIMLTRAALHDAHVDHELHIAKDGEKALAFLRRKGKHAAARPPDIVLLDLKLPRMDGHEVVAEMKADEALKRIPVIILSGSARAEDKRRSYEQHVAKYLVKPVAPKEYLAIVRAIQELCRLPDGRESAGRPH